MNTNYTKHLCCADKRLAKIITEIGSYSIKIRNDSFQALIESIIYQQLSGSAANTIYNRFLTYYKNQIPTPEQIISSSDLELRNQVGLSRMKITYLKDLSTHIVDGRLNLLDLPKMQDAEIISQLTRVKGIGRWTAEIFLIFCLARNDILPVTDLGLRNAMKRTYLLDELPRPNKMMEIADPWRPYRSIATWYLWKSLSNFNTIG
ncbi:MAG: DNA-3-methyladenine glycosylase [Nitrososphaeraceae archaeon]